MTTTENGAEPLLRLKGVSKNFGPVQALSTSISRSRPAR